MKKTALVLLLSAMMITAMPAAAEDIAGMPDLADASPQGLPSLKTLYAPYFDFGCAVGGRTAMSPDAMAFYSA